MANVPPWHGAMALAARRGGGAITPAYVAAMVTLFNQTLFEWIGGFPPSPHGVMFMTLQGSNGTAANPGTNMQGVTILNRVIFGNSAPTSDTEDSPGFNWDFDLSAPTPGTQRFNFNDATGGAGHGTNGIVVPGFWQQGVPLQVGMAYDVGQSAGNKRAVYFLNGVQIGLALTDIGGGAPAFSAALNTALNFWLNASGPTIATGVFSVGDVFFDTPVAAPVDNAGNPTFDIHKFYNSGPVNINGAAGGVWPLGGPPLVMLQGPSASFPTNQGTGGNPSKIFSNTLLQRVSDVHVGFGGTPDRPYQLWEAPSAQNSGAVFSKATGTYSGVTNYGRPIPLGVIIVMHVQITPANTAFDYDPVVNSTAADIAAGKPWVRAPNTKQFVGGGRPINTVAYTRESHAADVTAANGDWANAPPITWTIAGSPADFFQTSGWSFNIYPGATPGVAPVLIDSRSQTNPQTAAGQHITAPSVTATGPKSLAIFIFNIYSWSDVATDYGPPADPGQNARLCTAIAAMPIWTDEQINAIGATGSRTALNGNPALTRNSTGSTLLLG